MAEPEKLWSVRVTDEQDARAEALRIKRDVSKSDVIREAVRQIYNREFGDTNKKKPSAG